MKSLSFIYLHLCNFPLGTGTTKRITLRHFYFHYHVAFHTSARTLSRLAGSKYTTLDKYFYSILCYEKVHLNIILGHGLNLSEKPQSSVFSKCWMLVSISLSTRQNYIYDPTASKNVQTDIPTIRHHHHHIPCAVLACPKFSLWMLYVLLSPAVPIYYPSFLLFFSPLITFTRSIYCSRRNIRRESKQAANT